MKEFLTRVWGIGDNPTTLVCLCESDENVRAKNIYLPTRKNILAALTWLADVKPGDATFFYFSGHGSQKTARDGFLYESDGMDETILPMDYKTAGQIRDDDLADHYARRLPSGAKGVTLLDCCHSGTGLDLPYVCDLGSGKWKHSKQKYTFPGDVTLIAGCLPDQTSADLTLGNNSRKAGGAMTMAWLSALSYKPFDHTYKSLLRTMAKALQTRGFTQVIQLSSSCEFALSRLFS